MPVKVEWVEAPHIFQFTLQGHASVDEIVAGLNVVKVMFHESGAHPFCGLAVIMPDYQTPVGILKLVTHPAIKTMRFMDAAAITGVNHFVMGMLVEMVSRLDFAPTIHMMDSYAEALNFLQQVVRAHEAGL